MLQTTVIKKIHVGNVTIEKSVKDIGKPIGKKEPYQIGN
jgi:hypothetical protein|tara:strand:+ start:102 stop:218 length:117 start_codon:yes stop_codon:yes gene_type:complete